MSDWIHAIGGVTAGVTGVGPGDPMEWLPLELATRIFPLTVTTRRNFEYRDPAYDISTTGERVSVPREQLLDEVRRYGGYITFGDRTYAIANAHVHALTLQPEALSRPFLAESDIDARLGLPSSVNGTSYVRRYAEWNLTVAWHATEDRLINVTLGSDQHLLPVVTRVAVLKSWLCAVEFLKDGQLVLDGLRSTMIRHRRLTALLGAFELGAPKEFSRGEFLEPPLERYPLSVAAVRETPYSRGYVDAHELKHLFWRLLGYRRAASRLWSVASYDEASSPGALTVIRMTNEVNRHVAGALEHVDDVLLEMISPEDRVFSEAELVSRWGYVTDAELRKALADEW